MIAVVIAAFATAPRGTSAHPQHITGAGSESCAVFLPRAGKDGLSDVAALQWALGYLTGRSVATSKARRAFEGPEGIARTLRVYCLAHPDHQIEDAASSYFD